jgi:DNA polymerase III sliding clamp (beta) subunit (PCNA family)
MASTIPQALLPRPELRAALAIAGKVVERRTHKPILTNVLLRDGADGFEVVATNLDMAVTARFPARSPTAISRSRCRTTRSRRSKSEPPQPTT